MKALEHRASLDIEGTEILLASTYSVDIDLLQPADAFSLAVPLDARTVSLIPLDAAFVFRIDDQVLARGFVDRLQETRDNQLVVSGRCRTGRLVDESVDGAGFSLPRDTRLREAVTRIVGDWYPEVAYRAVDGATTMPHRVKCAAGMSRMEALDRVLEPLRLMSWPADQRLVIGRPDYRQAPAFAFVYSPKVSTCLSMERVRSSANRFATYEVGSAASAGNRHGLVEDKSGDLRHPKRLYVPRERDSDLSATAQAQRIKAQADASGYELAVELAGHGEMRTGDARPTLYQPDLVARCVRQVRASAADDALVTLYDLPAYITRATYTASSGGARTALSLVPLDTELV